MNAFQIRRGTLSMSMSTQLAILVSLSVLLWSIGAPFFLRYAHAAALTSVSDTLSDSDLSVPSAHTFRFTTGTALNDTGAADTITINFIAGGGNFSIGSLGASGITASGLSVVATGACTVAPNEFQISTTSTSITLTICAGDTIAATSSLQISTATSTITNPASAGSYVVRVKTNDGQTSSVLDQADTRVAILNDVVVTASVDTIFTFTVSGLATSSTLATGITATASSTPTALPFSTLTPGASTTLAQQLTVATNARNGFAVTVVEDQNLTSSTGADIDLFNNGATTSIPISWQTPSSTLNADQTYGHFGITSDDTDIAGAQNAFSGGKYVGDFNNPRTIFANSGPADGVTQNQGKARVGFTIEIGPLQEAGTDYTNRLTYVATPVF